MSTSQALEATLQRMRDLDAGAAGSSPADAWLAAAVLESADVATPDDQELAAYMDGTLGEARRAEVELALLADPELRTGFLLFADALSAFEDDPPSQRPKLSVVDGGKPAEPRELKNPDEFEPRTRNGPPRWAALAIAAVLVLGLGTLLRPSAPPPIAAELMLDAGPTVRGIPALPAGSDTIRVAATIPGDAWWAVVRGRPGDATRGPELRIDRPAERAAESPKTHPDRVLHEAKAPTEAGELAFYVVVADGPLDGLDRAVNDSLVRLGDREIDSDDFAKAAHAELVSAAAAKGWRVSKVVSVAVRGL